jgi:hypothetical protein
MAGGVEAGQPLLPQRGECGADLVRRLAEVVGELAGGDRCPNAEQVPAGGTVNVVGDHGSCSFRERAGPPARLNLAARRNVNGARGC